MAKKVEWNLAAMMKWEEITGRPFAEMQNIMNDPTKSMMTDVATMVMCGIYGAEFPNGDWDAIRKEVLSVKPNELNDFFSVLQPAAEADQ